MYGVNTPNKHQHSLREREDSKMIAIIKISARLPTFFKTTTCLFYKTPFLWVKFELPFF